MKTLFFRPILARLTVLTLVFIVLTGALPLAAFDNTNILVEEAVNHIYQQRYKQAHELLRRAYERSPRHPGVHFNLGRLFELTGNFDEALKEYRLAAALDRSMIAARRGMARAQVELKRIQAVKEQQQLAEPSSQPAPIITMQPSSQPEPSVQQRVSRPPVVVHQAPTPQSQPRLPVQEFSLPPLPERVITAVSHDSGEMKAEKLLDDNKVDEAITALNKILQRNPDSPKALFLLGKALSIKGDLFPSIKHLEEAIRVDKSFYDAYYLLGRNYARVNLLEDALKNYQLYYGVKPQSSVALEMARIYENKGRPEMAREYYSRANAMNPGNPQLQARLTETTSNLANDLYLRANNSFTLNEFEEAVSLFSQALDTAGLSETYRRDAIRKLEISRLRVRELERRIAPAKEGFQATRHNFGTVNLKYYQLTDINFKTRFTGPIVVEWRARVVRKIDRHGRDFLLMIKELSRDELDIMNRDRNDYRLNRHFNNQPVFLLETTKGGFPVFIKEGQMITFNGSTDWRTYNIINDLGQSIKLPSFNYISAYPN